MIKKNNYGNVYHNETVILTMTIILIMIMESNTDNDKNIPYITTDE